MRQERQGLERWDCYFTTNTESAFHIYAEQIDMERCGNPSKRKEK